MSSVNAKRTYRTDLPGFTKAFVDAGTAIGLKEKSRTTNLVVELGEGFKLLSFSWPASVRATITAAGENVDVEYVARNFGFGPVQTAHVRGIMQKILDALAALQAPA